MEEQAILVGLEVAVTGRLVSLTRNALADLVAAHGGQYVTRPTSTTSLLVIGAAGWPLQQDGRLTRSLERAQQLRRQGFKLEVLREEEFLHRIGTESQSILRLYTLAELCGMLHVTSAALQSWMAAGLLRPAEKRHGIEWFDFAQVTRCRTLCALRASGVNGRRLYRSIRQIQRWIPEASEVLRTLELDGWRLIVRDESGRPVEPHGQLLLDFDADEPYPSTRLSVEREDLFQKALQCEESGDYTAAACHYRTLLSVDGPDADVLFNLGNVFAESGRLTEAVTAYEQAVQIDPTYADAWSNLANLHADAGETDIALSTYQKALRSDSEHIPSLYGIADLLTESGRGNEAAWYWRRFLELETEGECADYARTQLSNTSPDRGTAYCLPFLAVT